jgi:hypothetical protein
MNSKLFEIVPELIEEEFNSFKFHSILDSILDQVAGLLRNPLFILPTIDEMQINRRVPVQLEYK